MGGAAKLLHEAGAAVVEGKICMGRTRYRPSVMPRGKGRCGVRALGQEVGRGDAGGRCWTLLPGASHALSGPYPRVDPHQPPGFTLHYDTHQPAPRNPIRCLPLCTVPLFPSLTPSRTPHPAPHVQRHLLTAFRSAHGGRDPHGLLLYAALPCCVELATHERGNYIVQVGWVAVCSCAAGGPGGGWGAPTASGAACGWGAAVRVGSDALAWTQQHNAKGGTS